MTTDNLDLSVYSQIEVQFSYYCRSMDKSSEDFWLQISTDGGSSFDTIEEWNRGDASSNQDRVYIDDVIITAR